MTFTAGEILVPPKILIQGGFEHVDFSFKATKEELVSHTTDCALIRILHCIGTDSEPICCVPTGQRIWFGRVCTRTALQALLIQRPAGQICSKDMHWCPAQWWGIQLKP